MQSGYTVQYLFSAETFGYFLHKMLNFYMKTKKDKTFVFLNTTIKPGVNQVLIRTEPDLSQV